MGDLERDTRVEAVGEDRLRAVLKDDWEIWGPMGGYVAAVALRAAGVTSPFGRPASLSCHYLGVASFGPVDIEVDELRRGKVACSQRVRLSQDGRLVLEALVWSIGEVEGLSHDVTDAPNVPGPHDLKTYEELNPEGERPFPFWDNFDSKPVEFRSDWPPPGPLPPVWRSWNRFRPTATFADPWVDAARSTILVDVQSWPSAFQHHAWSEPAFIAPSLDLYVAFHEPATDAEWLLADGYAPSAADGLIGWTGRLWSTGSRLLASGGGQALCRPTGPRA